VVEYRVPSTTVKLILLTLVLLRLVLVWLWDRGEWMFCFLVPASLALAAMREHGRCANCGVGLDQSILGGWVRR
jgi:hypothetical protein